MKKYQLILFGGIILSLVSFSANAQTMKSPNSKMIKVLADTSFLRAVEVSLNPGEKTDMHTHPANFIYGLTAGKLVVHYKDGKNQPYDLTPGFAGVAGPEGPHVTENVGQTAVKFLVIELKEHPYKEKK